MRINTLLAGGSFGRRATPNGDVAGEAAGVAKAIEGGQPVKLMWTREDDIKGGRYRPLYVHRLRAGLEPRATSPAGSSTSSASRSTKGTLFEPFK